MPLDDKAQRFLDGTFKSIIFFAILGAIACFAAVHFIENMFKDVIGESTKISNPSAAKTSTSSSSSTSHK